MAKMKEKIDGTGCVSIRLYVMSSAAIQPSILHSLFSLTFLSLVPSTFIKYCIVKVDTAFREVKVFYFEKLNVFKNYIQKT